MRRSLLAAAAIAATLAACQESLDSKAAREARLYTQKNCPAQIAENVTLDSLAFEAPTRTLHYYYTLSGAADTVGALDEEQARAALLSELKNTTAMMGYKEAGFRFAYTYHSQRHAGRVLFATDFSAEDYGKK